MTVVYNCPVKFATCSAKKAGYMINRLLGKELLNLAEWYPVVSVTGPRQSGKSTLVKYVFSDYEYVNLEDPATRSRAQADPTGFVSYLRTNTIIDEAQYVPELFSAIQARVDESSQMGQFVLSGSQNFQLLCAIKQSLAGRVGIAKLLPLSCEELNAAGLFSENLMETIIRGSYPRLYVSKVPSKVFYENYLDTYVTRDVVGYLDVRNEQSFRTFVRVCAARVGGILNISALARDVGVSVPTARSWLGMLESSYVVTLLRPYSANIGKRLVKSPKLYFYDTGLLCHLLSVKNVVQLVEHEMRGEIFENFIIAERLKHHLNQLNVCDLMYYRDDSKREVDLIDATDPNCVMVAEIKSGQTYKTQFARATRKVCETLGSRAVPYVIYGGVGLFFDGEVRVCGAREFLAGAAVL